MISQGLFDRLLDQRAYDARCYGWYATTGKRAVDFVLAGVGLVLSAIPLLLCGVLIRLTSPGPVLYLQERVGRGGRVFRICKLRTMRIDAEAENGPCFAASDDARITALGRVLRALRMDELPQLWNVLRGDMSLVGPRPERPCFAATFTRQIAGYGMRHRIRPGLTGWAQIHCGYCSTLAQTRTKTALDLAYLHHFSLALDLRILARTPAVLIRYFRREFFHPSSQAVRLAAHGCARSGQRVLASFTHRMERRAALSPVRMILPSGERLFRSRKEYL